MLMCEYKIFESKEDDTKILPVSCKNSFASLLDLKFLPPYTFELERIKIRG